MAGRWMMRQERTAMTTTTASDKIGWWMSRRRSCGEWRGGLVAIIHIISWWTVHWRAHHIIVQIHCGDGTKCQSPPRRIAPKPSASGIAHGVRMTPVHPVRALSCTRQWYGPTPLTTMVALDEELVLKRGEYFDPQSIVEVWYLSTWVQNIFNHRFRTRMKLVTIKS